MHLLPSYLKKGDLILIIATARKTSPQLIEPAIDILINWGLQVETGANLYKVQNQFAGSDEERASDLQWAINHPKAKAVLFSGGGYGSLRIIDRVKFGKINKYPKWFIGYSDVTVIHNRLNHLGIASVHGTMAFQFTKNHAATQTLRNQLFGKKIKYRLGAHLLNRKGKAQAEMVGGNLSLLYAVSGSIDDLNTKNKILFIEDLDEYLYHIDRMMLQLKRSGKLKHLKGLIVGGMSEMKDNQVPFGKSAEEIILDAVKEYRYPVCFNFSAGHVDNNFALCLGMKATLTVSHKKVSLTYL
jgi:muramoyltetrapeptide carboxypeptidase